MTVGDLRKEIEGLPDDMKIGSAGHFGEYLECDQVYTRSVDVPATYYTKPEEILCFSIEDAGEEPD